MKCVLLFFINLLWIYASYAQTIQGIITNSNNEPLIGANIYIKNSYDGTISGSDGRFKFSTTQKDSFILIANYMGYENYEKLIFLINNTIPEIVIVLNEKHTEIKEVVISAGTFIAGDKKRGIQMSTLDILTTPNSNGDIPMALGTLPGIQLVGEEGAIFVRGGEKYETKTYVDGMLVTNPYTSKVPDLPMRGRFSPSIFTGVLFSSGGYSAEYGQALSSALVLQSYSFPKKSATGFSFFPFGTGINHTQKWDSSSLSISVDYFNMKPYNNLIKQKNDWVKHPEDLQTTLMHRSKLRNGGLIKTFLSVSKNQLALNLPYYNAFENNKQFNLNNNNIYTNIVTTTPFAGSWTLKTGLSVNYDDELITFENFSANTYNRAIQAKVVAQNPILKRILVKVGVDYNLNFYKQSYIRYDTIFKVTMNYTSHLPAAFTEIEWKATDHLSARVGTRFEYSAINNQNMLAPRIAVAYKTGKNSQFSAAFGIFTQLPQDNYLKFNAKLKNEKAIHYILNYEYSENKRLFRVEAFSKEYSNLIRYSNLNNPVAASYNNNGYGFARGMELFLRDQKSLKHGEYWISYTFLDTRKLYKDAGTLERPYLFSKHSLNMVGKYYLSKIHSQLGLTYQFASGRPYYRPNDDTYIQGFTDNYNNISANISYLTSIFKCFTIVHLSVSNVFGFDNIYGYHFTKLENENTYTQIPIKAPAKRFIVLGVFITLDKEYITY